MYSKVQIDNAFVKLRYLDSEGGSGEVVKVVEGLWVV